MSGFIEKQANKASISARRVIYGIAINDASYITHTIKDGKIVSCPFYQSWKSMLSRCYDKSYHERHPIYKDCSVCEEWLIFSEFKKWMEAQDWKGKALDKDLIVFGNRIYSPDTCMFVSTAINNLFCGNNARRGAYPKGVSFCPERGNYMAQCRVDGKSKNLGRYTTPEEAEIVYLTFKSKLSLEKSNSDEAKNNKKLNIALIRMAERLSKDAHDISVGIKNAQVVQYSNT